MGTHTAVTATRRLWKTRGIVFYLVLVLAAPFIAWRVCADTKRYVEAPAPDLGIQLSPRVTVAAFDAPLPGARIDDRVTAIAGRHVEDRLQAERVIRSLPPGPVAVELHRGERRTVYTVTAEPFAGGEVIIYWVAASACVLMLAIGLLGFLVKPGTPSSWTFLVMCYAIALGIGAERLFETNTIDELKTEGFFVTITLVGAAHFFSLFPQRLVLRGHRRVLLAIVYAQLAVPVAWLVIYPDRSALWRAVEPFRELLQLAGGFTIVALMIAQYRSARRTRPDLVGACRTLLLAALALFAVASWVSLVPVLDIRRVGAFEAARAAMILFVVPTAYALVRHNAFAVDRFTVNVFGYAFTVIALGAAAGILALGVPLIAQRTIAETPFVLVAFTVAAVIGISPLYRLMRRRVDRWFSRAQPDSAGAAQSIRRLAEITRRSTRDEAFAAAVTAARDLQTDRAEMWLFDVHGTWLKRMSDSGELTDPRPAVLAAEGPLWQALRNLDSAGIASLAPRALPSDAQNELWEQGLAAAASIRAHGVAAGFIAVSRKRSGARFHGQDLEFLEAIAAQVGVALERPTDSTIDKYRIERRIGVGGMAEVFLAWQLGPGGFERKVALKRLLPDHAEDPTAIAMFLDEARIAAQLSHRNIVQIYEVANSGGTHYLAMELVDGVALRITMRDAARRRQSIPVPIVVAIISSVLSALAHAHAQHDAGGAPLGFVHRDVTPSNILITWQGEVKLVDFGIARAASRLHRTQTGLVKGTRPYMSPEQARGHNVDGRSDLFSVGVVLYELLTLARPYPEGYAPGPIARPSQLRTELPAALDAIVLRALAEAPSARFADADSFRAALVQVTGQPATEADLAAWLGRGDPKSPPSEAGAKTFAKIRVDR